MHVIHLMVCYNFYIKYVHKLCIGNSINIRKTVNLQIGEKCYVIGTLFKKMELKPVILKELSVEVLSMVCCEFISFSNFYFWL
jgi:hypothetical protein